MVDSKRRSLTGCKGQVIKGLVDLPLEIISDILTRLPIESIMTCRIVCKSWYGLTQDPDFIYLQLSRSNYQPARIILHNYNVNHLILLDTEGQKSKCIPIQNMLLKDAHVTCSSNGLICIASYYKLDPVFICNPITGKYVVLPWSDSRPDPRNHRVGLGFDPSNRTYKVARLYKDGNQVSRFEFLSLGESSWKELSAPNGITGWDAFGFVFFWNGTLCWLMISPDYRRISILAFGIMEEKFQIVSLPKEFPDAKLPYFDFQVLDGYLTIVEHDSNLMKMWRMIGNKIGDFSVCLEQTYDTHVRWNDWLGYDMLAGMNQKGYLLKVRLYRNRHLKTNLTRFFPQTAEYVHVDIPGLPVKFKSTCFKPSLVSPLAASCLSR